MLLSIEQEFEVVIWCGLLNFKSKSPEIHFQKNKVQKFFPEKCNYRYTVAKPYSKEKNKT